ncbi:unnamed protein product [Orchesella dallaii]|uniref:Cilia- and flagella-associated protein 97 n=1 Tax=Orchesella dallaii TaxID=48710 RepID=A0ABP1QJA6_9HEXA
MSEREPKAQPVLGLGDTGFDPDILTKEIDHDFFDDPLSSTTMVGDGELDPKSIGDNYGTCQFDGTVLPNKLVASESGSSDDVRLDKSIRSKHYDEGEQSSSHEVEVGSGEQLSSERSPDVTVHLEMGKEEDCAAASSFYSIESNATSPNYPRPKQCYQLQQRKKSLNSLKKCEGFLRNSANQFHPLNETECGLTADLDDFSDMSSSSSSSELDLYDFSESELESLDSETDDESIDMLERYLGQIDNDSDCSDLTEVSPLSSLAPSPLPAPPQFLTEHMLENEDINLETEHLCSAADGLQICHEVTSIQSQLEELDNMQARFGIEALAGGAPRHPLMISKPETAIIPKDDRSQDPNGDPEESDKVKSDEERGLCIDCCFETAKQILSRDSSPSRKGYEFLPIAKDEERSTSCFSATLFSDSIPRDDSSRSSSSAWSATNNIGGMGVGGCSSSGAKGRASSGSGSSASSGSGGGKRPPKNYTFTADQLRKIERENHILLRKILDTHKGQHHHHHGRNCNRSGHHHKPISASTTLARLRQQKRIKHENEILMKRLQTVKPSKEIEDAFKAVTN